MLFANGNNFDQQPVIKFNIDDLVTYRGLRVEPHDDYYNIVYFPHTCLLPKSELNLYIKYYLDDYFESQEKNYPIAVTECSQVEFEDLPQSRIPFDISLMPIWTTLGYEIFYLSSTLPEQRQAGSYLNGREFSTKFHEYNQGLETFSHLYHNNGDNWSALADEIGLMAKQGRETPVGIGNRYLARKTRADFKLAYLERETSNVRVNINSDRGTFLISEYFGNKIPNNFAIYHFRKPYIASSKFGFINTVLFAKLTISREELLKIATEYEREYAIAQTRVESGRYYSRVIEKLANLNNSDAFSTVLNFYHESQKTIELAIEFIKSNMNDSQEKSLLVESLNGISILKNNECLSSLSMTDLENKLEMARTTIDNCFRSKKITNIEKTIVDQLMSLSQTQITITKELQLKIEKVAINEAKNKTKFLEIQTKIKKFYFSLPSWESKMIFDDQFRKYEYGEMFR